MSPSSKKCWVCTVPLIVIVAIIITVATALATNALQITSIQEDLADQKKSFSEMHDAMIEMRLVLRTVRNIETKLDRHIEQADGGK